MYRKYGEFEIKFEPPKKPTEKELSDNIKKKRGTGERLTEEEQALVDKQIEEDRVDREQTYRR